MAIADAYKVEAELKKIHKVITELVGHVAKLDSRIAVLEKAKTP